jgi:hypothetical protein
VATGVVLLFRSLSGIVPQLLDSMLIVQQGTDPVGQHLCIPQLKQQAFPVVLDKLRDAADVAGVGGRPPRS